MYFAYAIVVFLVSSFSFLFINPSLIYAANDCSILEDLKIPSEVEINTNFEISGRILNADGTPCPDFPEPAAGSGAANIIFEAPISGEQFNRHYGISGGNGVFTVQNLILKNEVDYNLRILNPGLSGTIVELNRSTIIGIRKSTTPSVYYCGQTVASATTSDPCPSICPAQSSPTSRDLVCGGDGAYVRSCTAHGPGGADSPTDAADKLPICNSSLRGEFVGSAQICTSSAGGSSKFGFGCQEDGLVQCINCATNSSGDCLDPDDKKDPTKVVCARKVIEISSCNTDISTITDKCDDLEKNGYDPGPLADTCTNTGASQQGRYCKSGGKLCVKGSRDWNNVYCYVDSIGASGGTTCSGDSGIETAIGCIPTDPAEFVNAFLKFATAAGGGLALLLMIFGAFQMITSAGNADQLKAGREQFTSAIIGLLFIIFSVLLLQIIGVDILNLPGFI